MVAVVIENLGAGATGAGGAHAPEIVIGSDADDPAVGQPRDLFPDRRRLIVGVIDGDQKLVRVQTKVLGQKLPCKGNRLILEIVAKAEIPQHFKEGMVPGRIAHVVQIVVLATCPYAFLRGRRALVIPRLDPGEQVLELHHARVGEHQRRIIARHKRRAFDHPMPVAFEEIEVGRADVVQRCHVGAFPSGGCAGSAPDVTGWVQAVHHRVPHRRKDRKPLAQDAQAVSKPDHAVGLNAA